MLEFAFLTQGLLVLFISGILYSFSDFIMRALNRLPSKLAIEAMNAINVSVYKSLFMVLFMLLPITSVILTITSVLMYGWGESAFVLSAGVVYIIGMFTVTGRGNVPLNEMLKSKVFNQNNEETWNRYYVKWTRLNTLRCIFGVVSSLLFVVAAYQLHA